MQVYYCETPYNDNETLGKARERIKAESSFMVELLKLCDKYSVRCAPKDDNYSPVEELRRG